MFPLQPNDELVFGTPSTPHGDQILGDPISNNYSFIENNMISFSTSSNDKQQGQKTNLRLETRRSKSRDVERKRRQEMSKLCASLRSCLPLEHDKGKRSVCDEIQIAVDYIEQMQKNIQELSIRRDKLKKLSNLSGENVESPEGSENLGDCVMVNRILDGVEILISRSIKNSEFQRSRILAELQERELDVVSFVSTRTKWGFLHKIQTEARDMTSIDIWMLQDRLTNTIK